MEDLVLSLDLSVLLVQGSPHFRLLPRAQNALFHRESKNVLFALPLGLQNGLNLFKNGGGAHGTELWGGLESLDPIVLSNLSGLGLPGQRLLFFLLFFVVIMISRGLLRALFDRPLPVHWLELDQGNVLLVWLLGFLASQGARPVDAHQSEQVAACADG